MTDPSMKSVNSRERLGGAIYVAIFFAAGVGLASWLAARGSDPVRVFSKKDAIEMKMRRQESLNQLQARTLPMCDVLDGKIDGYDPGVNAIYEKNDIQYVIGELRRAYDENPGDKRYLAFLHLSDFYQMLFNDRQLLWSLNANLAGIQSNLDECELGLEKKKEELKGK